MEEEGHEKREEDISSESNNNTHSAESRPEVKEESKEEIKEESKSTNIMAAAPSHASSVKTKDEQQLTKSMRENPWMLSTMVLGAIVLVLLFLGNFSGGVTGNVVSSEVVGDNLVEYLNTFAEEGVTLVDVVDDGSMYLVTVEYKGEDLPIYVTKDGEYYTPSLLPISADAVASIQNIPTTDEVVSLGYTEEDNLRIQEFSRCLADEGLKVYAADWCGYCEAMKDDFGGQTNVEPFWIVCSDSSRDPTENAALCEAEGVNGYPTMKLNGEVLNVARTFEGLSEATGCLAPQLD